MKNSTLTKGHSDNRPLYESERKAISKIASILSNVAVQMAGCHDIHEVAIVMETGEDALDGVEGLPTSLLDIIDAHRASDNTKSE